MPRGNVVTRIRRLRPDPLFTGSFLEQREEVPPEALTAAADVADGAMVALIPTDADLDRIVLDHPDAEPREQLHLTLWFLGDAVDWNTAQRDALVSHVRSTGSELRMITARAFGVNLWNPGGDPAWVLAVGDDVDTESAETDADVETLVNVRQMVSPYRVSDPSAEYGAVDIPRQHSPWVPHVCLAYSTDLGLIAEMVKRVGPITFDRLRIAFGGATTDVPLASPSTSAPPQATMSRTARLWHGAG